MGMEWVMPGLPRMILKMPAKTEASYKFCNLFHGTKIFK